MLEIKGLTKVYGTQIAVDGLDLAVDCGSVFGFVGPNGAGKTTTFKIITGLLAPSSGRVLLSGVDVAASPKLAHTKIGYMPDFFGVYDNLKVREYMDFYADTYYIPYSQRKETINNLLELVDLQDKLDAYVDSLSRGMKQRLCLARSLVHDPELLVLDEPASGLDPRSRIEMKEVLKQLRTLGKTVIISSHILPELAEMCSSIGIIHHGKMVATGTVEEILKTLERTRVIKIKPLGDMKSLVQFLREHPEAGDISQNSEDVEFSFAGDDEALALIANQLVQRGIRFIGLQEKQGNLEEIFMELTKSVD